MLNLPTGHVQRWTFHPKRTETGSVQPVTKIQNCEGLEQRTTRQAGQQQSTQSVLVRILYLRMRCVLIVISFGLSLPAFHHIPKHIQPLSNADTVDTKFKFSHRYTP